MSVSVSVVVTTYNRHALLMRALEALDVQSFPKSKFEIIVVDDGSTDSTSRVVQGRLRAWKNVRYLPKKHEGLGHGRNAGIAAARGELIAFTDDDVIPDTRWVESLWKTYTRTHAEGIEGRVTTDSPRRLFGSAPENPVGGKYIGCNSAYTKKVLAQVGGYDPRFFWVRDDSDMAFRVLKKGRIAFAPDAIVYHPQRDTDAWHLLTRLSIIQSDILLFMRHPRQYWENFGFPGGRNLLQSGILYLTLAAWMMVDMKIGAVAALVYLAVRFFSMRNKVYSLKEGLVFVLVMALRDVAYPFAYIYYWILRLVQGGNDP